MAVTPTHAQKTLTNGVAHSILNAANGGTTGLILENRGTGIVYFTLDGTAPTKTHGSKLQPGQTKKMMGAAWADPATGESFLQGEARGVYFGGSKAGGANPNVAKVNVTGFVTSV